jgi:hypothetical protein
MRRFYRLDWRSAIRLFLTHRPVRPGFQLWDAAADEGERAVRQVMEIG